MACLKSIIILLLIIISFPLLSQDGKTLKISENLNIHPLEDSIFIHESIHDYHPFGPFPSNGLIIVSQGKGLMIDSPVDDYESLLLYQYFLDSMDIQITHFIPGHFHEDCLGGMEALHTLGVTSSCFTKTYEICHKLGLPLAHEQFDSYFEFDFYGREIDCRYFGPGHTEDNISIWVADCKVLFGGCLIKSLDYQGTGNLRDANPREWPQSVKKLASSYPDAAWVIPGHGSWGGQELFNHTISIFERFNE